MPRAILSFNIANGMPDEASFAVFGGYDTTYNLTTFPNANKSGKWAIAMDKIGLEDHQISGNFSAILDSGSSLYSFPAPVFDFLVQSWSKQMKVYC